MPYEYIQDLLIQKVWQVTAVGFLENQLHSLLFYWTGVFCHMPMLSYFNKVQLTKMQLMSDMESKVPNSSTTLEKKMLLYACSFMVSHRPDCNRF